jgi:vacuolar protein sorting-associated protein 26
MRGISILLRSSYAGINVKLRYFLRVTLSRRVSDLTSERDLWVYSFKMPPEPANASIKMEVGIEDCLHIEFEYNKVFTLEANSFRRYII